MTCSECEQLFDAYLDGQLAGSLRLEFDAHRVRCRRCQQTLSMLEAIGHVIASDAPGPELSGAFTDRVMGQIERPRRVLRFPLRVAIVTGAVVQAAAVLILALVLSANRPAAPAHVGTDVADRPADPAVIQLVADAVEDRLWEMFAAGESITTGLSDVALYFNITLPEQAVRESEKIANVHPLQGLMDALVGGPEAEPEPVVVEDGVYSI